MSRCARSGKRRYASESLAVAGAVSLIERGRDVGHRPLNVYHCDDCGDFHVGHRPIVLGVPSLTEKTMTVAADEVRCSFACSKIAVDTVVTNSGAMPVCKRHLKRFRSMLQRTDPKLCAS